ncbi:MAG TPA: hypothetical protein DHW45_03095 [Candidatus Latescibacteria bacterium]|nr:hypothetical protein [Candidatus Latescibacterota bacterium]
MAVDIHKRIRDLRKTKGMSAKDVSERMGISRPFYTQLEGGTRRLSVQYLEGIAQALGTTVADLYFEDGLPASPDVVAKAIPSNNTSRLAERLRPYLGENSDNAAESLYNLDKATKSLRKFKAENK